MKNKYILLLFLIFNTQIVNSQYDNQIYSNVSNSMKFENWEKLKSVILRYEEKIKESIRIEMNKIREALRKKDENKQRESKKKIIQNSLNPDKIKECEIIFDKAFKLNGIEGDVKEMNAVEFTRKYKMIKYSSLNLRLNKQLDKAFKILSIQKKVPPMLMDMYINARKK